jgi:N-acetylated-alpha-linked acidic dipeptidase
MLSSRAVAYLNVDCAVSGPGFHASATPQLDELIKVAAQEVRDPDNATQTIYESWIGSSDSVVEIRGRRFGLCIICTTCWCSRS